MEAAEIHAILTAEAARVALPKHYVNDLTVHDLKALRELGTQDFIYVLRTCGTFLVHLDCERPPIHGNSAYSVVSAISEFGDDEMYWYHFHEGKLHPIDAEKALRLCVQSWGRKTLPGDRAAAWPF